MEKTIGYFKGVSERWLWWSSLFATLLVPFAVLISILLYPDYPPNENLSSLGARSPALSNVTKEYVQPTYPELFNIPIMIAAICFMALPILRQRKLKNSIPMWILVLIDILQSIAFVFLFLLGIFDLGYIRFVHDQIALYFFYLMMASFLIMGISISIYKDKFSPRWKLMLVLVLYLFLISVQRQLSMWKVIKDPYYLSNGPYQKLWGIGWIILTLVEIRGIFLINREESNHLLQQSLQITS